MRKIPSEIMNLAYMVRDNAVHGWRTVEEIAQDEGYTTEQLVTICNSVLNADDMTEIEAYSSVISDADAEADEMGARAELYNYIHHPVEQAAYLESWSQRLKDATDLAESSW